MSRQRSGLQLVRVGLPFFAIVVGSAYFLKHFQQVRYDFRQVRTERDNYNQLKNSLAKEGVRLKEKVSVDDIYDEVSKIDTENWQNIRGPRDTEDNTQYLQAKSRQQAEAKARREKKRSELRTLMDQSRESSQA